MDNKELISVVIPCYNVEKYLDKCLDTIFKQTYKNLEVIAIDDCSTDKTYEKLLELKDYYGDRLIVKKNQTNLGAAFSRNIGIEESKGKYIGFIDPDDFIDLNFYEVLYEKMKKTYADIVVCDIVLVDEDGSKISGKLPACNGKISKFNIINNGLAASPCNKLFLKDLIKEYKFLEGKINEDVASVIPAIIKSKKVEYAKDTTYYYTQRNDSTQNSEVSQKRFDMFCSVEKCLERIKEVKDFKKYKDAILYNQLLLLYLYVIPKEKNFFNRQRLIKIFIDKQKIYKLYVNPYIKDLLDLQTRKNRIYCRILIASIKYKASFIANVLMETKKLYLNIRYKGVINNNINIKDLINLAKKNSKIKESVSISVVVPNYNYKKFLLQRIYSILNQKEHINELILLDDCSSDNSRELIDSIECNLEPYIKIKKIYNKENTGSAFKQWERGFKEAESEYVWIAEADDYSSPKFLKEAIKPIKKSKNVYISYVDTAFMDSSGFIILKSIKKEIDIMKTGHWDKNYVNLGTNEIDNYAFLNCTIANVSSIIIKNENYKDIFKLAGEYKQAGDWLFYLEVMERGCIAYCNKSLNYYRVHGNNITSTTKKKKHLEEIKKVHEHLRNKMKFKNWQEKEIKNRYKFLNKVWALKTEKK